jgi:hypothetical protein
VLPNESLRLVNHAVESTLSAEGCRLSQEQEEERLTPCRCAACEQRGTVLRVPSWHDIP